MLVIPKYHAQRLHELPAEYHADLGKVLGQASQALVKATKCEDYNILQNNGSIAHQLIKHVHFHIIPKRTETEGLGVSWPAQEANKAELAAFQSEFMASL